MDASTSAYLRSNLEHIEAKMKRVVAEQGAILTQIHPAQLISAENLLHYLSLRSEDIRDVQDALHNAGLSSLASSESHILSQLQAILEHLGRPLPLRKRAACDAETGRKRMLQNTQKLFGSKSNPNIPHIMVTLDASHADSFTAVKQLLSAGMNVARINCAHDDAVVWSRMIGQVRKASETTGLPCKIYMDLAGPKIRTSILGKGRKKGRAKVEEGKLLLLAEADATFSDKQTVIGCTLPGIVPQLQAGERVFFDDGLVEAKVEKVENNIALLRVLRISGKKPRIKAEKGINFPDSTLTVKSLTKDDRKAVAYARLHADIVGYSFVRSAGDVRQLQELLYGRDKQLKGPAIVLKIETPEAVKNLPALLLQGMHQPFFGVMIARGDLAVEIGFERMSEIQEQILWICESAHVPVIWATQVLENLNKSGLATRSEVTDAAHAAMAECVMINKGDYTLRVIETLKDIMLRSGAHHVKKRFTFRPLGIALRFIAE